MTIIKHIYVLACELITILVSLSNNVRGECKLIKLFLVIAVQLIISYTITQAGILKGKILDQETNDPIPLVTIRIEGTGQSMLANDDGEYRVRLEPGFYNIKFSHVAYYSQIVPATISDSTTLLDIKLKSSVIEIPGTTVYTRAYEPAQEIIVKAIANKANLLRKIQNYQFDAYTRLVIKEKIDKDSSKFFLITETQLAGYWEQPDNYKEILLARKQSQNIKAENNLVTVGEIFNFNANRLDFGTQQVVSPTATDALDFYNYYLLDTLFYDTLRVFELEIEPKSPANALFAGIILIADSSYAVMGVDVTFNEGFDAPYINDLKYEQKFAHFDNDIWLPIEIGYSGEIRFPGPLIPDLDFNYRASLHKYTLNEGVADTIFNDYALEVAEKVDDLDSAQWFAGQMIPLTEEEQLGYKYIDSMENRPKPIHKKVLRLALGITALAATKYNFFHFSRVEGPYLGISYNFDKIPGTSLFVKSGYSFDNKFWQHRYKASYTLFTPIDLQVKAGYHNEITHRPVMISSESYNPTFTALTSKVDPYDYYKEEGYNIGLSFRPVKKLKFSLDYLDVKQESVGNVTNYSFLFSKDREHRPNLEIVDGKLRTISGSFKYDSRPLWKNKGKEKPFEAYPQVIFKTEFESAWPQFIDNDFKYHRVYSQLLTKFRFLNLGISQFYVSAGYSDRALPPQRYFTIDYGDMDFKRLISFKTLGETNFIGDKALSIYYAHNFGGKLFRRLRLPLLKDTPLSFYVYGGSFWTNFGDEVILSPASESLVAKTPYSEIGFGFGRIPPIFLKTYFTWQLSDYDTNKFTFKIGLGF